MRKILGPVLLGLGGFLLIAGLLGLVWAPGVVERALVPGKCAAGSVPWSGVKRRAPAAATAAINRRIFSRYGVDSGMFTLHPAAFCPASRTTSASKPLAPSFFRGKSAG